MIVVCTQLTHGMVVSHRQYFEPPFLPPLHLVGVFPQSNGTGGGGIGLKAKKKFESTSCLILGSPVTTNIHEFVDTGVAIF